MSTPYQLAQDAWSRFDRSTRELGDEGYLEACDELANLADSAANAKREELG